MSDILRTARAAAFVAAACALPASGAYARQEGAGPNQPSKPAAAESLSGLPE